MHAKGPTLTVRFGKNVFENIENPLNGEKFLTMCNLRIYAESAICTLPRESTYPRNIAKGSFRSAVRPSMSFAPAVAI